MASKKRPAIRAPSPASQITGFLAKYEPGIARQALAVRRAMRALMRGAYELVYDNYNALVFGFSATERPSDAVLSVIVLPDHVTIGFLYGARLKDPGRVLKGGGNQVRSVRLESPADLALPKLKAVLTEALAASRVPFEKRKGSTVVRSISVKQRPRRR